MDKFRNKYRISSTRLQNWDYGWNAAYFVTICTKDRVHNFGKIANDKMILSPVGIIADVLWYEIKNHAKNVELDVFQGMPNHIHGIIVLNGGYVAGNNDKNIDGNVETRHALSLRYHPPYHPEPTIGQTRFQNQGKNTLSSIIGSYKSAVTKHANRLELPHGWQSRFHDHIIRNDDEFNRIRNYIINNPANWKQDKFNNKKEGANG